MAWRKVIQVGEAYPRAAACAQSSSTLTPLYGSPPWRSGRLIGPAAEPVDQGRTQGRTPCRRSSTIEAVTPRAYAGTPRRGPVTRLLEDERWLASFLLMPTIVLLGLLMFLGAGILAFSRLNIEAYPNPAPVILEITAQAPGLSAEEMERYYTIPLEVGLAATPGVDVIRSTSFYGLSFVRVVFQYGVDYYFALQQTAINLQQNVSLPLGES